MYVGRTVVLGRTKGRSWAGYRVSSRSFPNRRTSVGDGCVLVAPLDLQDMMKNPYIAYNCLRLVDDAAVVTNGTQTEMIAEKIKDGMKPLDAIAISLVAYGYERDELETPRIAGVVRGNLGWLGIAREDEVRVKRFSLEEDCAFMVATYEMTDFRPADITGDGAVQVAEAAFDLPLERPVCSAAAFRSGDGYELAAYNPE